MAKPTTYLLWTDGNASKVTLPPSALRLAGWTPGNPPPPDYMNWLFWLTDQWIQYLDQSINSDVSIFDTAPLMRLINGGGWSWNLTTQSLAWSSAFNLSIPSVADADNQAASGSVTMNDGDVAYLSANVPFSVAATTTNTSAVLTGILEAGSIAVGQTVTGTGIPGSTTVTVGPTQQSDGTYNVTISAAATASNVGTTLTFSGTGAITVSNTPVASLVPSQTTVVIARRVGSVVFVGVNATQMVLRDLESKFISSEGYNSLFTVTAGQNLTQGQAVYISSGSGGDSGRTAGRAYPVDSGAANGASRNGFCGFVLSSVSTAASVTIVAAGKFIAFTSLTPGALYYADPATPGGVTSTKPATSGQWIVPVGLAHTSTELVINPALSAANAIVSSANAYPNFFCTSEADLATAITSATSNGGGVICLLNSFNVTSAHTIPTQTTLIGRKGGSILTLSSTGALTFADEVAMRDVYLTTALTSGTLVTMSGNRGEVSGCKFTVPSNSSGTCIAASGNDNLISKSIFAGVISPSTGIGITYSGINNTDTDCVFMT